MHGLRVLCLVFKGVCRIAGSLFFCGVVAAGDPPPVRFAAWNLRNYRHTAAAPASPVPGDVRPKPPAEVAAVTRIIAETRPDIAGFCEAGGPEDVAALQQRLKEAGVDLPHSELVRAADPGRHLVLLSRFPIVARQSRTDLAYLLDDTKLPVQRGFLDVTLQVTETYRLRCLGAHLKSRREVPEAGEALMRRNEAHLLRQTAERILAENPGVNLLVYGDFNATREEPAVRAIAGRRGADDYLTALIPEDDRGERWTFYFPEADRYERIDYLFASRGLVPEVDGRQSRIYAGADWAAASDHRLLSVDIRPVDGVRRVRKPRAEVPD